MFYPLAEMTCIVGSTDGRTIIMGADSAAIGEDAEIYALPEPKVFAAGPYLFGVAGSYRIAQIIRHHADLPEPPSPTNLGPFLVRRLVPALRNALETEGSVVSSRSYLGDKVSLLVGSRGQLWHVCSDLTVLPEIGQGFAAIGSGRLRAYGALHALQAAGVKPAERRLKLALTAAAAFTSSVRPPWHFVRSGATTHTRSRQRVDQE